MAASRSRGDDEQWAQRRATAESRWRRASWGRAGFREASGVRRKGQRLGFRPDGMMAQVFSQDNPLRRQAHVVSVRVDEMFERIKSKLHAASKFLLCLLPETMSCLLKPRGSGDDGLVRESPVDSTNSGKAKSRPSYYFKACRFLDQKWEPKFIVFVAHKNHHTKFFQTGPPENVPPDQALQW